MTNELTKKEPNNLVDQNMIDDIRKMSGEFSPNSVPFIPLLKVNNESEKKIVNIDGIDQEVDVPPKKGFVIYSKDNNNESQKELFADELNAVILKVRFIISSKFNVQDKFYSDEFDYFTQKINVMDSNTKDIIITGTYKELVNNFKTGELNTMGKPKKSFDLKARLYIHILDTDKVYRLEVKGEGLASLFEYKNQFGKDDTYVSYLTKFELESVKQIKVSYWKVNFIKGERINLSKEIPVLKGINSYFDAKTQKSAEVVDTVQAFHEDDDVINVDDIPF